MSRTIDDRVVSLEFDNRRFESNVSTTMSTLDKLKQKLNFTNSAKTFENVTAAANKVNLSGLGSAVETLQARFSALDVVAVTALANITNSAIQAGKNMVNSLTLDPIISGFKEYETQLNAVQTILANTESKGTTLDEVNAALDELNTYADLTIYNFTEMTRNIGTFTAAGVDLDKSVTAIKGIANLAAASGSSSLQASTAMYQLSQALAAGRVSLMDWNSVVNADMGGELFQNALKRTAENFGTDVDAMIAKYGSFRESLTQGGWLTAEVLTETLTQISGAYSEADLIAQGFTEQQAKDITAMAQTALDAATKVKTFTQLVDTAREAVGSGWAQTWEIIFGDFEEAKSFWTGISDTLTGFIGKMSNSRNYLLENAFGGTGESLDDIAKKMEAVGVSTDSFTGKIKELAEHAGITNEEFDKIVSKSGSLSDAFKDGSLSSNLLTQAMEAFGVKGSSSYDILMKKINDCGIETEDFEAKIRELAVASGMTDGEFDKIVSDAGSLAAAFRQGKLPIDLVSKAIDSFGAKLDSVTAPISGAVQGLEEFQNIVNKTIRGDFGNGAKRIDELAKAGYNYSIVQGLVNKVWERNGKTWKDTTITSEDLTEAINNLSDEELKSIGYTKEQAEGLKDLAKQADASGMSIEDLINSLDQRTGRELLIDSFANIATAIGKITGAVKTAWNDAFPPMASSTLYNILKGFNSFTEALVMNDEMADKLTRTLKGIFAVIDLISMVVGGSLKIAFKVATVAIETLWQMLGFGADSILDITATIGDAIVAFRNWVEQHNLLNDAIEKGIPFIIKLGAAFIKFIGALWNLPAVQKSVSAFSDALSYLGKICDKYLSPIGNAIGSFVDEVSQLKDVNLDNIGKSFNKMMTSIRNGLKNVDLKSVGKYLIEGLVNGIRSGASMVWTAITTIAQGLVEKICELLGIHSPSVVAEGIGYNFILGLVNGIQNGLGLVGEILRTLVDTMKNVLSGVDFTDLVMVGGLATFAVLAFKMVKAITSLFDALSSIGDVFEGVKGVLDSVADFIDAKTAKVKAEAMKTIATAILILAGALVVLTNFVDYSKIWQALGTIAALGAVLLAMQFIATKIGEKSPKGFIKMSGMIIAFGAALLIVTKALKNLSDIDPDRYDKSLSGLLKIMFSMAGIMVAFGVIAKLGVNQDMSKVGLMFVGIAAAMSILMKLVQTISQIDDSKLAKGLIVIGIIGAMFIAFIKLSGMMWGSNDAGNMGKMFTKMAVAIGILVLVTKLIGTLDVGDIIKGIAFIGALTIMFGLMAVVATVVDTSKVGEFSKAMQKWAVALGIIALVMKIVATMSVGEITKGILVFAAISALFAAFTVVVSMFGSNNFDKAGNMFLKVGAAFMLMALAIRIVSGLSSQEISKGLAVITGCGLIFTAFIAISKLSGQYADKAGSMIMKMSVGFLALALVFRILRGLEPEDINRGMTFMAGCTVMFGALIALSKFAGEHADKAGDMIMKMAAPIAVLAIAVGLLSFVDQSKLQSATLCMAGLMAVFGAVLALTKFVQPATKTILVMTGAVAALAVILALMSNLPVESTLASAGALSMLMLSMAASLLIISKAGASAMAAIPALYAISGAVAIIAIILGVMDALNVEASVQTSIAISVLLLSMAAVCAILGIVGEAAPTAIAGAAAFDVVVAIIGGLIIAIGALMTNMPKAEEFLNKGLQVLGDLATGLGSVIGKFVSGIAEGVMSSLPKIGTYLSEFMTNAEPFIAGASNIDESSMNGVKAMADAIMTLTSASVLDGLTSWLTGGTSFEDFGEQIAPLGDGIAAFSDKVANVNVSAVTAAAQAIEAISGIDLPKSGGLWQKIVGESESYSAFGDGIVSLGSDLMTFSDTVSGLNTEAVNAGANAIQTLAEINLPTQNGLWQLLAGGEMSMETFGSQLKTLGSSLIEFSNSVTGVDTDVVANAATAVQKLADIDMPEENGLFSFLAGGKMDMNKFSTQISYMGTGLASYASSVSSVDTEQVTNSAKCLTKLVTAVKSMTDLSADGAKAFTTAVNVLAGANISGFISTFNQDAINSLSSFGGGLVDALVGGFTDKTSSLTDAASKMMDAVLKIISDAKSSFKKSGSDLSKELGSGISDNAYDAENAARNMADDSADAAKEKYGAFYLAGKYLVQGFANGISTNSYLASAKAKAMAKAAEDAAKAQLDINSPSKVFEKIGGFVPQGFVNGIAKFGSMVKKAASSMGETAVKGTQSVMARLSSMINSDMDVQPTIRPVVDLSDVSASAMAIDGMLGANSSIGVMSNVRAISSMMNRRNQNGANADVVAALNDLKGIIGTSSGDTYQINGVTYDDGSNISKAVKDIVRAVKIERRV